jgi:hypothetical protein
VRVTGFSTVVAILMAAIAAVDFFGKGKAG